MSSSEYKFSDYKLQIFAMRPRAENGKLRGVGSFDEISQEWISFEHFVRDA